MVRIYTDRNFEQGFSDRIQGAGSMSVINGILKCTGGTSDAAVKDYYMPAREGMTIEVEATVRALEGDVRIAVDSTSGTSIGALDYVRSDSKEWTRMRLSVKVPFGSGVTGVRVVLGKWGSQSLNHDIEYRDVKIDIEDGFGSPLTLAQGCIKLEKGIASLSPNYKNCGIKFFDVASTHVKVYIDSTVLNIGGGKPIIQITGTNEHFFIPVAGAFDHTDSSFIIRWTNGTSFQDISTLTCWAMVSVFI